MTQRPRPVPESRLARALHLGGLAAGVGGRLVWDGARAVAQGQRPGLADLLATPANARALADSLAGMRGAAMKLGQLLSMDAGDLLPPEVAGPLARLRDGAAPMPPGQLGRVLDGHWGPGWQRRFARFDVRPLASASIGQVHRAVTHDGRDLAVKVQHPGVRRAIDSDVANLGALIARAGVLPPGLDLPALMAEVRGQLHLEADYTQEAAHLRAFGAALAGDAGFLVPGVHPDLSGPEVLVMDFARGDPIEGLAGAPQAVRDAVVARLVDLVLRELFDLRLIQTDPNFANFRYQADTGRVVLLDFGATRAVAPGMAEDLALMLRALLADDRSAQRSAALRLGYLTDATPPAAVAEVTDLLALSGAVLRQDALDPARDPHLAALRARALELGTRQPALPVPPFDLLLIHRKMGGLYLLAQRLDAGIDLRAAFARWR